MSEDIVKSRLEIMADIASNPEVFYASEVSYLGPSNKSCIKPILEHVRTATNICKQYAGELRMSGEFFERAYKMFHKRDPKLA